MDSMGMDRLMKAILIRGEQLANVEGAVETAQLLQNMVALLNYYGDERSWGPAEDELRAMRDYANIMRSCFGWRMNIQSALSSDRFIRRRVLLGELMEICSPDRIRPEQSGKTIDIEIIMLESAEDGTLCRVYASFRGDGHDESIVRNLRC